MSTSDIGPSLRQEELCPASLLKGQEKAFEEDIHRLQNRKSEFLEVTCPACGRSLAANCFSKYDFSYVQCQSCATIYMSPRPAPAVMKDYYENSKNYAFWAKYIFPASEKSRVEKLCRPRMESIICYCKKYSILGGTLVEIGGGFGSFAEVAQESRYFQRVVVIEPTPEMAESCRKKGAEVIQKPVEEVNPLSLAADVVVAFEVIEHLFDPGKFVANCTRILKPGGLLILTCPNGMGFDIQVLRADSQAVDPEHVNLFNPKSIRHLVESHGLECLEVTTPGRLDAELVRNAMTEHRTDLLEQAFLKSVLVDQWEMVGEKFQRFLADAGLSSHMWMVAKVRN